MIRPALILLAAGLAAVPAGDALADKLVVFHNGRTLRAVEVRLEGEWSYLTLGKGGEMGIPARLIAAVTEIESGTDDPLPNVRSSASGGDGAATGRPDTRQRGGAALPIRDTGAMPDADAAEARREALRRAASQAYTQRTTPDLIRPPGEDAEAPAGQDLAGSAGNSGGQWPSLLDQRNRRGAQVPPDVGGDDEPPDEEDDDDE